MEPEGKCSCCNGKLMLLEQFLCGDIVDKAQGFRVSDRSFHAVGTALRLLGCVGNLREKILQSMCAVDCPVSMIAKFFEYVGIAEEYDPLMEFVGFCRNYYHEVICENRVDIMLKYLLKNKNINCLGNNRFSLVAEIELPSGKHIGRKIGKKSEFIEINADEILIPMPDYSYIFNKLHSFSTKIPCSYFVNSHKTLIPALLNRIQSALPKHKVPSNTDIILKASENCDLVYLKLNWGSSIPSIHKVFQYLIMLPDLIPIKQHDSSVILYGLKTVVCSTEGTSFLFNQSNSFIWQKTEAEFTSVVGHGRWYDVLLAIIHSISVPTLIVYEKSYDQSFELSSQEIVALESRALIPGNEFPEKLYNMLIDPTNFYEITQILCFYCKHEKIEGIPCEVCGLNEMPWTCYSGHANWAFSVTCEECSYVRDDLKKNGVCQCGVVMNINRKCCKCGENILAGRFFVHHHHGCHYQKTIEYCKKCAMKDLDSLNTYIF